MKKHDGDDDVARARACLSPLRSTSKNGRAEQVREKARATTTVRYSCGSWPAKRALPLLHEHDDDGNLVCASQCVCDERARERERERKRARGLPNESESRVRKKEKKER